MRFLLLAVLAFAVSSCASISNIATEDAPIHLTLNTVKQELRIYQREIENHPETYTFSCNGVSAPASVKFKKVKVELAVSEGEEGKLGGESVLASAPGFTVKGGGSGKRSTSDKMTISLKPEMIPVETTDKPYQPDGIAEALLALTSELAKVDEAQPCLAAGEATLELAFTAEKSIEVGAGVNFVIIKIGGERKESQGFSNTLTLELEFDGVTKKDEG